MDDGVQRTATKMGIVQAVLVALISGAFGLGGAWIQFAVKNPATASDVVNTFDRRLPVGTIVSSMIAPRIFSKLAGDPGGFDPAESVWVPADGREVAGSNYAKEVETVVPDLRGVFLRGLNETEGNRVRDDEYADPQPKRRAGDFQLDAFAKHDHMSPVGYAYAAPQIRDNDTRPFTAVDPEGAPERFEGREKKTTKTGDDETRPKNAAVYFYIKIN